VTLYGESVEIPSVGVISLLLIFVVIFDSGSFSLMVGYLSQGCQMLKSKIRNPVVKIRKIPEIFLQNPEKNPERF
jgi:hypothetical protein